MATKRRGNRFTRKKRGGTHTKWAIVQYDDRRMTNVDNAFTARNKYYANKWGHKYILRTEGYDDMPPYWRKVFLVKEMLNTDKYKGVLWLDTDAVIYNLEMDINTLVEEGKHMYFSTDIAQSPDSFCAGVWFVLNTALGKEIMERWVEKYDKNTWRKNNKWRTDNEWAGVNYEQGAFNKYLRPTYEPHLKHLNKNLINALLPGKGTFICHFYFGKEKRKNFINTNPLPKNNVKGGFKNHMTRKLGVNIISYKNIKSMKKRKSIHSRKSVNKRVKLKRNRRYYKITGGYNKIIRGDNSGAVVDEQSLKRAVVFQLDSNSGFFSVYRHLLLTYLYAKKINTPFFIEHNNWQYTYKDGWHDYFKSLNVFNKDDQFDLIEFFNTGDSENTTLLNFHNDTCLLEGVKETFILHDPIQASIDSYIKEIGGEYTSLYVRRGDKINERELVSLDDILAQTTIKDDGRIIFVQTDDYNVVKDMRGRFPSCKIMTLTPETAHGANNQMMLDLTPEQRKKDTEELLISCVVSARANIGWSYYMSNVGYFIKLLGYDNIQLYLDTVPNKE